MVEQFNRILQVFGSNRVRLECVSSAYIAFAIKGWADFQIDKTGVIWELAKYRGCYEPTARSQWLEALIQGKQRNDAGEVA